MSNNVFNMNFGHIKLGNTKYGWMFFNGPYIGKCLEIYGEYSESEVSVFKYYLKPGDYVIEVGANIGSLTLPMSHLVGETGRVVAFESHPDTFNILCSNLAINTIKNVKPINAFVAHDLNVDTGSPVWGKFAFVSEIWQTSFFQMDAVGFPRLDFIKVDVDGNELTVLQSGENLIRQFMPVIYFENDFHDRSTALLQWVMDLGYRIFFHMAPICSPENFYGNPENHWHPQSISSLMMLAVPPGKPIPDNLREVLIPSDWWE